MTYGLLYIICFVFFKICFRYKIYGRENLPRRGPYIIASNHLSFLDPIVIGLITRQPVSFMARDDLFKPPIFAFLIQRLGAFPLDRDKLDIKAVREALHRLRQNKILCIFPEGRRSPDGTLGEPMPGVGVLAQKAKVRLVPVYLEGTNLALPLKARFIRLKKIRAFVGRPIEPDSPDAQRLVQRIWEEMHRLKDKARKLSLTRIITN